MKLDFFGPRERIVCACILFISPLVLAATAQSTLSSPTRASVSSAGTESNGASMFNQISGSGRYIVFTSAASNLVTGDTNGVRDVFLYDQVSRETERVSVATGGVQANAYTPDPNSFAPGSWGGSVSNDGRFIAFESNANNLVLNDTNDVSDAFVHDRQTGTTKRISVSSNGTQMAPGYFGAGTSIGPYGTKGAKISGDGTHVAFASTAGNLVSGDTNLVFDVFVHRLNDGQTIRASVAQNGLQGNAASAFDPLIGLQGGIRHFDISANGRRVTFISKSSSFLSPDTNQDWDVFWKDLDTAQIVLVNRHYAGGFQDGQGSINTPRISGDGNSVVFQSGNASNVNGDNNDRDDLFVRSMPSGSMQLVNRSATGGFSVPPYGFFYGPNISYDGRKISFTSVAQDLVASTNTVQPRIYTRDMTTAEMKVFDERTDQNSTFGNDIGISSTGESIAFDSDANYLVGGDNNAVRDVFFRNTGDSIFTNGFER